MIRDVILKQKAELEERFNETYIGRQASQFSLSHNLINVIMGPRRAGKSFFAIHFLKKGEPFGYANFDDEELIEVKNYDDILLEINQAYGKPKLLFLDEIQNL